MATAPIPTQFLPTYPSRIPFYTENAEPGADSKSYEALKDLAAKL
jgi:hypothetical protein